MKNQKSQQKIALVTGANRGIGFEVCRQLAQKGLLVILTARNPDAGESAARQLRDEGLDVKFHKLDVTSNQDIETIHDDLIRSFGRIDVLVNNAGVFLDPS